MGGAEESPPTLPITDTHSHPSLDDVTANSTLQSSHNVAITQLLSSELVDKHMMMGPAAPALPLCEDEVRQSAGGAHSGKGTCRFVPHFLLTYFMN